MILQSIFRVLLALLLLFSLNTTGQASGSAAAHAPLEKVSLQLKWLHQFQFAGYYAAQTQGFYAEEGLDVTIRPRDLFKNNIQQVLDGEAQYGVADNILLLYRARGEPVVIVAPILQHSPQTLVTLQSSGIRSPYDLDNRNIAFYQHDVDGFALLAMFEQLGIHPKLKRVKVEADPAMLARGDVSAYPGYLSNEPFLLQQQGHAINLIRPASYGIDLYGDMLFTTQQELDRHPDRVARFKRATLKGWHYALQHKQELAEYIRQHLNPSKSLAHLLYEAEAIEALVAAKTVPIGTLDEGRLRYIGDLFVKHGLLDTPLSLEQGVYRPSQGELTFSAREQAWIREHPLIRVAVDREWRPIEFVDEHGRLNGLSAGFLGYLSQKTGLRFEPATDLDWPQAVAAMKRRELDLYSAVSEAPGRSDYVSFTAPYLQFPMVIATQRDATYISDLRQLKDQQLAVVTDYAAHAILNTHYPDLSLHQVNTPLEGLHAVSQGQAYAYIDNLAVISHLINQHNLSNLQISGEMPFRADVSMAIRSDWPELHSIIQKTLHHLSEADKNRLSAPWLQLTYKQELEWRSFASVVVPLLLILLVGALYNRRLSKLNHSLILTQQSLSAANQQLEQASITDPLTGLYNRGFLDDTLLKETQRANRHPVALSMILIDLDDFKQVNDQYGHLAGDQVLIQVAHCITQTIRHSDSFGRWGGEEFLLICPDTDLQQAKTLAEKLRKAIQNLSFEGLPALRQTVSIGVSQYQTDEAINKWLARTDRALYQAKRQGKNRFVSCDQLPDSTPS